jgi:hypothetical protein
VKVTGMLQEDKCIMVTNITLLFLINGFTFVTKVRNVFCGYRGYQRLLLAVVMHCVISISLCGCYAPFLFFIHPFLIA